MHLTNRVFNNVTKSDFAPKQAVVELLIPGWGSVTILASWLISWQVRHVFAFVPLKDAAKMWNVQILDCGNKKGRISAPLTTFIP